MSNLVDSGIVDHNISSMFLTKAMRAWFESKHQRVVEVSCSDSAEGCYRCSIVDTFDVLVEAFPYVNLSFVAAMANELEAEGSWISNQSIDNLYFASVGIAYPDQRA